MSLLLSRLSAVAFDPAYMAAVKQAWPVMALETPQVVASGLTPSDLVNP